MTTLTRDQKITKVKSLINDPDTTFKVTAKSFGPIQNFTNSQYGIRLIPSDSDWAKAKKQIEKFELQYTNDFLLILSADKEFVSNGLSYLREIYNKELKIEDALALPHDELNMTRWTDMLVLVDTEASNFEEKHLVFSRSTLILPTLYQDYLPIRVDVSMSKITELINLAPHNFKQKMLPSEKGADFNGNYVPNVPGFGRIKELNRYQADSPAAILIKTQDPNRYTESHNIKALNAEIYSSSVLAMLFDYILSHYSIQFDDKKGFKIAPIIENLSKEDQSRITDYIPEFDDFIQERLDKDIVLQMDSHFNQESLLNVLYNAFPAFSGAIDFNFDYFIPTFSRNYNAYKSVTLALDYTQLTDPINHENCLGHLYQAFHSNASCSVSPKSKSMRELSDKSLFNSQTGVGEISEVYRIASIAVDEQNTFDNIEHTQYRNTATLLAQLETSNITRDLIFDKKLLITNDSIYNISLTPQTLNLTTVYTEKENANN